MAARLFRRVTPVIHKLDHAIGRLHGRRRVLVELRTPVYHAVLAPVADALANDPGVDVWFTSEYPDRIRPLVGAERFRTRANVEWRRFHLYLNADPWAAANLRRCAHRVTFVVKLHDRSLDADPKYHGGVNWRARMKALERPGRVRYVEQADATPLLAAADVMVTDHSSVGFEFLVLDRPLLVFDAPDLPRAARINPEKVTLLRSAATLVRSPEEVGDAAAA